MTIKQKKWKIVRTQMLKAQIETKVYIAYYLSSYKISFPEKVLYE